MESLSPQPNKILQPKYVSNQDFHRFAPTEKPRTVIEPKKPHPPTKIASGVSFSPVATVSLPDKTVFVRPVKNTHNRAVSPNVMDTEGKLKITPEKTVQIGENLHAQIRAKVNSGLARYLSKSSVADIPPANPAGITQPIQNTSEKEAKQTAESKARNQVLKAQLEEINKALFAQIKEKIAQEIKKQSLPNNPITPTFEKTPASPVFQPSKKPNQTNSSFGTNLQKQKPAALQNLGTTVSAAITTQNNPAVDKVLPAERKFFEQNLPENQSPKATALGFQEKQKTAPKVSNDPTFSLGQYKEHIYKLEEEIELLNKEINYLDRTIADLEKERDIEELSTIERKIDADRKMLQAVTEWRSALNNLINSHTVALKYLKQKTDWLESQVNRLSGHHEKHLKEHRKPRPIEIKIPPLPADQLSQKAPATSREVQTASFAAVKNLGQETLNKEQPNIKPNNQPLTNQEEKTTKENETFQSVKDQTLKPPIEQAAKALEEISNQKAEQKTFLVKPSVTEVKTSSFSKEELKNLVKEVVLENKEDLKPTQVQVSAVTEVKPPLQSSPQKTQPQTIINLSQEDIEKQILEAAEKEEAEKEAREKAKREEARKAAEQKALSDLKTSQAEKPLRPKSDQSKAVAIVNNDEVSQESLEQAFTKLKTDLTTLDNKNLSWLTQEKRAELIQKLQTLEKESEISRQFDDLKAAAERRRINAELQNLLKIESVKPQTFTQTTQPFQPTREQIELLKQKQNEQRSFEQKAKIISEIKKLERQAQAKKAAEITKATVKAQPAYGKMLPNTPTIPNIINGLVKDSKGLLLPTVIIIVKDQNGEPVRALKTNKVGQFALSTPVPNGTYTLEVEKEGYEFDIIEIDVNGTIMQPIEIKAK